MEYFIFFIGLVALVTSSFWRLKKKDKGTVYSQSTPKGKFLIFTAIICYTITGGYSIWDRSLAQSREEANRERTKGLLPDQIGASFIFKYDLDSLIDQKEIYYLDSLSNNANFNTSFFLLNNKELNWNNLRVVYNILYYFYSSTIHFVKNSEPLFKLNNKADLAYYDDLYRQTFFDSLVIEYDKNQNIVIVDTRKFPLKTTQERKVGITSWLDFDESELYITSPALYGLFDPERVLAHLVFDISQRTILFDFLFCYEMEKEYEKILKKKGINGEVFFFKWDLSAKLLMGSSKSIKERDTTNLPAVIFYKRNPR